MRSPQTRGGGVPRAGASRSRRRIPCASDAEIRTEGPRRSVLRECDRAWSGVRRRRRRRSGITRLGSGLAGVDARGAGARSGSRAGPAAGSSTQRARGGSGKHARSTRLQRGAAVLRARPRRRGASAGMRRAHAMGCAGVLGERPSARRAIPVQVRVHAHDGRRRAARALARSAARLTASDPDRARGVGTRRAVVTCGVPRCASAGIRGVHARERRGVRERRGIGVRRRGGERKCDVQHPGQQSHEIQPSRMCAVPLTARSCSLVQPTARVVPAPRCRRQLRPIRCSAYHAGVKVSEQNCQPVASAVQARVLDFSTIPARVLAPRSTPPSRGRPPVSPGRSTVAGQPARRLVRP